MNPREGATTDSVDGGDNRGGGALTSLPPAAEITPQLISENLAAGREWIQRGLPVFPIAISWDPAKGKTNKRPLTAHGFKDATNDPATLEHLVYDGVTRLKPGEVLACGLVPGAGGFVVFDDDNPPEVARLDRDLRLPPHTYRPKTGSGCEHRWLRKREDVTISNASPWDGQGVDIRADAGYVVCPGTATPWGEWTDGDAQRPWGTFATVPQAVWEQLAGRATGTEGAASGWKRYEPAAHDPQLHPATVETLRWLTDPARGENRVDPAAVTFRTRVDGEPYLEVTRPGKGAGVSGTIGYVSPGVLYVFSSNWPGLSASSPYSLWDLVAAQSEQAEPDPAEAAALRHQRAVSEAAAQIRIREQARALVAAEKAAEAYQPPPVLSLPDLIEQTDAETVCWRWEGLAEVGDRTLIEAQAKTGKTTFLANMVRSAVSGLPLLDHFRTTPLPAEARLLYIDTELGRRRLARWMGDTVPAQHRHQVLAWSIAGRTGSLDVRDDSTRARMVDQIGEALAGHPVGLLLVDVASAWTAPLGIEENDNSGVRAFCEALHTFSLDLGAEGVVLAHHAGHNAERSRGASAFRDWPDVFITLTRSTDGEDSGRYLSALGRGVDVPESRLAFDPETRLLSIAGSVGLNRRNAARDRQATDYLPTVVEVVTAQPGLPTRQLRTAVREALRAQGVTLKVAAIGDAVTKACDLGLIRNDGNETRAVWRPITNPSAPRGHGGDTVPAVVEGVSPRVPDVSPGVSPRDEDTPCPVSPPLYKGDTHGTHPQETTPETRTCTNCDEPLTLMATRCRTCGQIVEELF